MILRNLVLRGVYHLAPFNLKADAVIPVVPDNPMEVSCLIPTYQRPLELKTILNCLSRQELEKDRFEVIVIEDGRSRITEDACKEFSQQINLHYLNLEEPAHLMGRLRNIALEHSRGHYLLFLDDDTLILQNSFLRRLVDIFKVSLADIVQPCGRGLDPYSFATRCCAYRRQAITDLGGFISDLASYEDIDLGIRALILNKKIYRAKELEYYHPPLYFASLNKPIGWGYSFSRLRKKYSLLFWLACFLNGLRFLPFLVLPSFRLRQWGKISLGILLGSILPFIHKEEEFGRG